ncbi:hypothetical protein AMATHDRAFT_66613 [Amanita thiersii Skay4041]|uniref:Uncharacterized protein n=1 Tax=Amanita thiersii Skay4041 TaxID=703135 RepID=A0A2A9NA31_9AGAR|nr:hypothetical protein AMATHDRAFT_66613 [Amanita thiersii Skay4041]
MGSQRAVGDNPTKSQHPHYNQISNRLEYAHYDARGSSSSANDLFFRTVPLPLLFSVTHLCDCAADCFDSTTKPPFVVVTAIPPAIVVSLLAIVPFVNIINLAHGGRAIRIHSRARQNAQQRIRKPCTTTVVRRGSDQRGPTKQRGSNDMRSVVASPGQLDVWAPLDKGQLNVGGKKGRVGKGYLGVGELIAQGTNCGI